VVKLVVVIPRLEDRDGAEDGAEDGVEDGAEDGDSARGDLVEKLI
jgi:hypothetical protein